MKWTGLNQLREQYLSFFESKGHTRLSSASLVPQDEASLLLINSGMAPLKKYFMGLATLPGGGKRATSCQKCIRTPDIENVGRTSRHGTYFEMLGNFSFGDYFKEEATTWAWEFCTQVLDLPVDRLYVSVFQDDDEAYDIWTQRRGVDPSHMVRLGREDNFWEIGAGPCGPCSEIYFDRGPEHGCGSPDCKVGCECDRFVEFWNLVFTQFDSDGRGNYTPLEHPNIDTGMGLERLACIMQGVDNLFEVDTIQNIMKHILDIAGVTYKADSATDVSIRVITDHIRSTTFLIGDGVVPQNEGRGYVLRRLLRRAARHGRLLGIKEPFLYQVCQTVIRENQSAYPELTQNQDYIVRVIQMEEERFAKTIDGGLSICQSLIQKLEEAGETVFPGEEAFKLYDTYGFPIDLTREICEEHGLTVDQEGFDAQMKIQRETAREATRAALGDAAWTEDALKGLDLTTRFEGYTTLETQSALLAILRDGELAQQLEEGEDATLVLDRTPFYAEGGGQVGDTGTIHGPGFTFTVTDCRHSATGHIIHLGTLTQGTLTAGAQVTAAVDAVRRRSIMRNHSACHLLQKALQEVLGDHVHQAGSYVDERVCRFDFSHFSAMTQEEIHQVEDRVNEMILDAAAVTASEMGIQEAKALGAMALFGEKYGDRVRVVNMEDCSIELCGGTHVSNTAQLGLFRILKESSVAAGVRRIEATTGQGVLSLMREKEELLQNAAANLKLGSPQELVQKTAQLMTLVKERERMIAQFEEKIAAMQMAGLLDAPVKVGDLRVVSASISGAKAELLRHMCDNAKSRRPEAVVVLTSIHDGKGAVVAGCGAQAVAAGVNAGQIVKAICALTGGKGGGRPDSAMGSATEIYKIDEALAQVPDMVRAMVKV